MANDYRQLDAFRLALALADELHVAVREWPSFERWSLGLQMVRAADSIGANIAEAYGRWHRPDQRRHLYIARGSLYETEYWIRRATDRQLLDAAVAQRATAIGKTLSGLIKSHART